MHLMSQYHSKPYTEIWSLYSVTHTQITHSQIPIYEWTPTSYNKGSSISLSCTYHPMSGLTHIWYISSIFKTLNDSHIILHNISKVKKTQIIYLMIKLFSKYDDIWKTGGAQHLIEHKT